MWVVAANAMASILALVNFLIGSSGHMRWMYLIACLCFALTTVREFRKIAKKV